MGMPNRGGTRIDRVFRLDGVDLAGTGRARSLTDQAYGRIRNRIVTCSLEPGRAFIEADLAQELEMSKTPVREALLRLQMEGFVQTIPRRGYMVTPIHLSDIDDLFRFRSLIEGECAARATEVASDEDLAEMRALAAESDGLDSAKAGQNPEKVEHLILLNNAFHECVAAATGSDRLHRTAVQVIREFDRFYFLEASTASFYAPEVVDHSEIAACIAARDGEAARQAIVAHIVALRGVLISALTEGQPGKHARFTRV